MSFTSEAYPDMAEGYNNFSTNGADYISGVIPSSLGILNVTGNWWGEQPQSQKFNVQNGTVDYELTYQGAPPRTDYYDLSDIGFGLYDTVYVEDLGDTPGAEELFMQAVIKERLTQYTNAINLYKQLITNYRNTSYAVVSLTRIFNCYEKKLSNNGEYQLLQNYIKQIRISNQIPAALREAAEDYVIKTKVRMGLLQNAVNNYQQMYQQNQNNPKGIHALLNKEVLLNMIHDTTDNMNMNSLAEHKLKIISMVSGKDITGLNMKVTGIPKEFILYQNYPNPFNPSTIIKYDIPKTGLVTLKIYDILGKELYSNKIFCTAGTHTYTFDGTNLASGLYFYRRETGSYVETKKMVLIK
jgi:tetratricopeptide (TPR) repeat protein